MSPAATRLRTRPAAAGGLGAKHLHQIRDADGRRHRVWGTTTASAGTLTAQQRLVDNFVTTTYGIIAVTRPDGSLDLSGAVTIDNGTLGNAAATSMSPAATRLRTRPAAAGGLGANIFTNTGR